RLVYEDDYGQFVLDDQGEAWDGVWDVPPQELDAVFGPQPIIVQVEEPLRTEALLDLLRQWAGSYTLVRGEPIDRAELVFDSANGAKPKTATLIHECLLIAYFSLTKDRADKELRDELVGPDRAFTFFRNIHSLIGGLRGQNPMEFLFVNEIDTATSQRWPCLRMK